MIMISNSNIQPNTVVTPRIGNLWQWHQIPPMPVVEPGQKVPGGTRISCHPGQSPANINLM